MTQQDAVIVSALLDMLARGEALPPVGTEVSGTDFRRTTDDFRRTTDDDTPVQPVQLIVKVAGKVEPWHLRAAYTAELAFAEAKSDERF